MSFFSDFSDGLTSYGKSLKFIKDNRLSKFFIFPILLNILLYFFGFLALGELTDQIITTVEAYMNTDSWDFWGAEALGGTIEFLLWLVLKILSFLLLIFLGGHLVLILLSPVLAYVSEQAEQVLEGTEYPFNFKQFVSDIIRGVLISLRNFGLELGLIIICFFISLIPVIGLLTAPFLFFVSAYYYGFSFIDYNLERRRYKLKHSVSFMKRNKGLVIGNGFVYALVLFIPLIGVSIAGFIAIISTVSATLSLHKKGIPDPPVSLFKKN